ncbi:hypothetical protein KR059_001433 [Drosophila kikkawai]|nr:hypothetical protein KR059_001433 [Drosophila kikkawai]
MVGKNKSFWAVMSDPTSMEGGAASSGRQGGEQSYLPVPHGNNGHASFNDTPTTSQSMIDLTGPVAEETNVEAGKKPKRSSEGMKAKAKYKAALKIRIRLQDKLSHTPEEKEQLAWAMERIEEGRQHFAKLANMASTGGFANKVEEMFLNRTQSSTKQSNMNSTNGSENKKKAMPANQRQSSAKLSNTNSTSKRVEQMHANRRQCSANHSNTKSTSAFANKVEQMDAHKRRRSIETAARDAPVGKRHRGPMEAGPSHNVRMPKRQSETKVKEGSKRHLIVALIDWSDGSGQMTEAQWKIVHAKLVESLFARMTEDPSAPMPTFDGAGWLNGVKILKCKDDPTRNWLTQTVGHLKGLWKGARLEVVDREFIPSVPKAKVLFPIAVQKEQALQLLQRQNPDVPTADWKILHLGSRQEEGGQSAILQINRKAEDILYPRYGKMAWGMGSVYLRLKKRHPGDQDAHTLQAGEVEKDLGLVTTLTNEPEEDGDLTNIVNTSAEDDYSAAAYPP